MSTAPSRDRSHSRYRNLCGNPHRDFAKGGQRSPHKIRLARARSQRSSRDVDQHFGSEPTKAPPALRLSRPSTRLSPSGSRPRPNLPPPHSPPSPPSIPQSLNPIVAANHPTSLDPLRDQHRRRGRDRPQRGTGIIGVAVHKSLAQRARGLAAGLRRKARALFDIGRADFDSLAQVIRRGRGANSRSGEGTKNRRAKS